MNKDEILRRSRNENIDGDEREVLLTKSAENNGFKAIAILSGSLMAFGCIGLASGDVTILGIQMPFDILMSLIWFIGMGVECYSKYQIRKKKKYLVYLFACFILCAGIVIKSLWRYFL